MHRYIYESFPCLELEMTTLPPPTAPAAGVPRRERLRELCHGAHLHLQRPNIIRGPAASRTQAFGTFALVTTCGRARELCRGAQGRSGQSQGHFNPGLLRPPHTGARLAALAFSSPSSGAPAVSRVETGGRPWADFSYVGHDSLACSFLCSIAPVRCRSNESAWSDVPLT